MHWFILLCGCAFILVFNAGLLINCFQLRLIPPPHVHKDEVDLKDNDVLYILHDLCFLCDMKRRICIFSNSQFAFMINFLSSSLLPFEYLVNGLMYCIFDMVMLKKIF